MEILGSRDSRSADLQCQSVPHERNFVPAVKMHVSVSAVLRLATVPQSAGSPLLSESRCSAWLLQVAPSRAVQTTIYRKGFLMARRGVVQKTWVGALASHEILTGLNLSHCCY